jgi:hypothetical protein
VRADGVVIYLDNSQLRLFYDDLISVYGSPTQPDVLNGNNGDYSSLKAAAAWSSAPKTSYQPINISPTRGAPRERLDNVPPTFSGVQEVAEDGDAQPTNNMPTVYLLDDVMLYCNI